MARKKRATPVQDGPVGGGGVIIAGRWGDSGGHGAIWAGGLKCSALLAPPVKSFVDCVETCGIAGGVRVVVLQ